MKKIFIFVVSVCMGLGVLFSENIFPDKVHAEQGDGNFSINVISVGNGESILIQCGGENMLIDAGYSTIEEEKGNGSANALSKYLMENGQLSNDERSRFEEEVKRLAEENPNNTVTNFLENLGIKEIDHMIATHPHYDHIGGFIQVIKRYAGADTKVWWSQPLSDNSYFVAYQSILRDMLFEKGAIDPFYSCNNPQPGDYIMLGKGNDKARVLFLTSSENDGARGTEEINNESLVVRVDYKNTSYLFTGDLQREGQLRLLKNAPNVLSDLQERALNGDNNLKDLLNVTNILDVDVLKLPHHGMLNLGNLGGSSKTSGNIELFNAAHPSISLVSTNGDSGMNNYSLPGIRTRRDLSYSDIYSTATNGNLKVTTDGTSICVNGSPLEKHYHLEKPQNFSADIVSNGVELKWSPVENAQQYRVYYQESPNDEWHWISNLSPDTTHYTFDDGIKGKKYWFVVRASYYTDGAWYHSDANFSNEITYPAPSKEFSGFHAARVFESPNASKYWSYDPYRDVWMNRMTKYNGKALLLTRQMVKDGNTTYYSAYYNGKWVDYVNSYALKNTVTKDTYQGWGTYEDTFNTPNPAKYWRYDPYKNKWLGTMTQYKNKKLDIKRQLAKPDGSMYYSAYYKGKWIGYVNSWGFQ